jgi:hypothetical protein
MKLVMVTAEPFAGYHMKNIKKELDKSNNTFTHLIPYNDSVIGDQAVKTTYDISILEKSDRVIIIGDIFTPWTELVAYRAKQLNKEIIISQIPYGYGYNDKFLPKADGYTAVSKAGAELMSKYHSIDISDIIITGHPEITDKIKINNTNNKVLVLTTKTDLYQEQQKLHIKKLIDKLLKLKYSVTLRTHPRENESLYIDLLKENVLLSKEKELIKEAKEHKFAVGIPGSAHLTLLGMGLPVISYNPIRNIKNLPDVYNNIIKNKINNLSEFNFENLATNSDIELSEIIGYNPLAGKNLVNYWSQKYLSRAELN